MVTCDFSLVCPRNLWHNDFNRGYKIHKNRQPWKKHSNMPNLINGQENGIIRNNLKERPPLQLHINSNSWFWSCFQHIYHNFILKHIIYAFINAVIINHLYVVFKYCMIKWIKNLQGLFFLNHNECRKINCV